MKRKKLLTVILSGTMLIGMLAGCSSNSGESKTEKGEEKSVTELTMLVDTDITSAGLEAVSKLAEEKLGIKVVLETRPGGPEGINIVKTRLASGDMSDLCVFNSGALLNSLNPKEYFIDISEEDFVERLDDTYKASVTVEGGVYGVPFSSTQAGAVVYNKEMYEKYNLDIPKTWDEFLKNCDILKEAGETAILGTYSDPWTTQVAFLGNNYNLIESEPDFVTKLEEGVAKYETTPGALRGFEKIEDTTQYYNEDYLATTYDDGCDRMANGEAGHWFILTQALSNIYELYGEDVNKLGIFGVPGDDADNNGITVWMPSSIYGNKNSDKVDAIKEFMEFYVSDEALDAYTKAILPDGPYCVKGYELPEEAYDAVANDMQAYFDEGKTQVAMEFLTSVKGAECAVICQELGSGQTTAVEAAKKYDADCAKQAKQLGLDWE